MLQASHDLITLYKQDKPKLSSRIEGVYLNVIGRRGSLEDASALLPLFLEAPQNREVLLGLLMRHGEEATAEALFANCVNGDALKPNIPEEVLHALGYLGYRPAQPLLWHYARREDYWSSRAAVLGLLHLPCNGLAAEIEVEIKKCYGQNLFPEFIPALAYKTSNLTLLEGIFKLGDTTASVDCNGGLILGVALYGKAGLPLFKEIIWREGWEANSFSTGSGWWLYLGCAVLGLTLAEIYAEFKLRLARPQSEAQLRHDFGVISCLLTGAIYRGSSLKFVSEETESYLSLISTFFDWSTPDRDDSISGLAYQFLGQDSQITAEFRHLQELLRLRAEQELIQ